MYPPHTRIARPCPQPLTSAPHTFKVGLLQEEKELYSKLFKSLDPEGSGIVTGEKARATFEKSGLPPNILGEIWQLSDDKNLGFLTQFGFCHAMRLIGYTQAGHYPTAQLAEVPGPLPKFSSSGTATPAQGLRPQSTSSSLLQSQPSSLIPQNTATQQSLPQAPLTVVSAADYERFAQMYVKTTGSPTATLDGNSAKEILMKARLPTVLLGQIWSLVDVGHRGYLDMPSFIMAMHLIHGLLSGSSKQLPPFLPDQLWSSVNKPTTDSPARQSAPSSSTSLQSTIRRPQASQGSTEWSVSAAQKQQYDAIFDSLDKAKAGSLQADQVASFFMTSRLEQADLATIWDLADIQNTGVFGRLEFGIALFLINRKRSGLPLPDVIPNELIQALKQPSAVQSPPPMSPPSQPPQALSKPKSSMDELADIFGSSASPPVTQASLAASQRALSPAAFQKRTSSSDLATNSPVKMTHQLTSSFKPSSSFGQTLISEHTGHDQHPAMLGDDVVRTSSQLRPAEQAPAAPAAPAASAAEPERSVNYDALRNVPPPPRSRDSSGVPDQRSTPQSTTVFANDDLLADTNVSGQLSEATADIANFSNQIKSLTTQTSNLHEKKLRAEKELARINVVKDEINARLKMLRTSYASEVKQVEQIEKTLVNAKEETEALRSEASIAEAKFNNITNEVHNKQLEVEEHQKVNSALREKLGALNAEIAELESVFANKPVEATRLSNEVNVKRSQVQVALVKLDELRTRIAESESSKASLLREIENLALQHEQAQRETIALEQKDAELQEEVAGLESRKSELESTLPAKSDTAEALVGAGVAVGISAAVVAGRDLAAHDENPASTTEESTFAAPELASSSKPKSLDAANEVTKDPSSFSVAALVDEVRDTPAEDMTGVDDVTNVQHKDPLTSEAAPDSPTAYQYEKEEMDLMNQKLPEMTQDYTDIKRASLSSAATESYRHTEAGETGETPITSPANSEYRYQSSASGVVGGMMGMPGVLVGVQRTESLTSSVQNNPSLSVRDDNIDDVSDRDTLEEDLPLSNPPSDIHKGSEPLFEGSSDNGKLSPGMGLFEMVEADEDDGSEAKQETQAHPLAQSFENPSPSTSLREEEFPAIRELDFDDSSSEDDSDNEVMEERFDDAVDKLAPLPQGETIDDSDFDDLQPAAAENLAEDSGIDFGDEFDNLQIAKDDRADPEAESDFDKNDISMDSHFTGIPVTPNFGQLASGTQEGAADEWEQLFAGFGNNSTAVNEQGATDANPHALAIQELEAMGFAHEAVVRALEREDYNVEAATNYLLDNA